MRGSPASLGGFSAVLGMLVVLALIPLVGIGLVSLFALTGLVLGMVGAWELGRHRKAGSFVFLIGGLLPVVSYFVLVRTPDYDSLLFSFLVLEWWSPLLILAGVLGLLNLPSRQVSQGDAKEVLDEM